MKNQFTISSAYPWANNDSSKKAINYIAKMIKDRFNNKEEYDYNINYRKLRASAGRTMLDSIYNRINDSQVIIIDLSENNSNVFLEAGIALAIEKNNKYLSVYFIREKKTGIILPEGIPSDLQGYFISEYTINTKGEVIINDAGSLRMSIESDVKDYFNLFGQNFNQIDEMNF